MSTGNKLRVMFFPSDPFGCGNYRMIQPARALSRAGHDAAVSFNFDTCKDLSFDIYHFQRITTPKGAAAIDYLLEHNKCVMMDMDDDLFKLYPGHPSNWYFRKGYECLQCGNAKIQSLPEGGKCPSCGSTNLQFQDRLKICSDAIHRVDGMTFSTPELCERYSHIAKSSHVVGNYIEFAQHFSHVPKKDNDYIAVGWAGSFTHELDILDMGACIKAINESDNAYLFLVGVDPALLHRHFASVMDHGKVVLLDPVDIEEYPNLLSNFDIGLAPVLDNAFNRAKSELKPMEYGAVGIPCIASSVVPYQRYIEQGKTGFVAKRNKDWYTALKTLLENEPLRKKMGAANYAKSLTRDLDLNIHERIAVYREVLEKSGKENVPVETPKLKPNPFPLFKGGM